MAAIGYTEHGLRHAALVAAIARNTCNALGYEPRLAELAAIAGYLHDIGNVVSRFYHPQQGEIWFRGAGGEVDLGARRPFLGAFQQPGDQRHRLESMESESVYGQDVPRRTDQAPLPAGEHPVAGGEGPDDLAMNLVMRFLDRSDTTVRWSLNVGPPTTDGLYALLKKALWRDFLDLKKLTILPNTAGCFSAEDAIRHARLARELLGNLGNPGAGWVKLECLGDAKTLLPDPIGTPNALTLKS